MKLNKKVSMFGKRIPIFVLVGLLVVGLGSAALVTYLSNTINTTVTVVQPFLLEGEQFTLEIEAAGEDGFALVKITNQADVLITADVEIAVNEWTGSWTPLADLSGIDIALTDDINYCFTPDGDLTGVENCEEDYLTWIGNNIDWCDWYSNTDYAEAVFYSPLVVNTDGNSFHSLGGYNANTLTLPGLDFEASETVYGVIYVATDVGLVPGYYQFTVTVVPPTP